jgi:subtilisin family serine protease
VIRVALARASLAIVAATALCVAGGAAAVPAAASSPARSHTRPQLRLHPKLPLTTRTAGRIDAALRSGHGRVDVMLELTATPAALAAHAVRASAHELPRLRQDAFVAQRSRIGVLQRAVSAHFGAAATRAARLFSVSAAYDGIAVRTDASRLPALASLPGVKAVHQLTPKHLDNTVTVPLIHALQAWGAPTSPGSNGPDVGQGVTVGVIDTGVDYTHADFGGPGTTAAYDAAKADDTAAPTYPNTAKIHRGIDFAGDAYDPSAGFPGDDDTNLADAQPQPDSNPLDCNGHGTHVAGTAAGLGVTTAGDTYPGPYSNALDEAQFRVGPGVAPAAEIVPIKIFGCGETGTSSDLITQALDYAMAPDGDVNDHLDVVNMSLGSDFSPPDDPDAVAANNASLAGVTVVAASGNAGDLFNVGGAPGNATRALAVAASDDSQDIVDGLQVDSPASAQDPATSNNAWPAEESSAFAWASRPAVQGDLATIGSGPFASPSGTNNSDGCDPLDSTDAAKVAGKIALLSWTDDDSVRRCGSAARTDNVTQAGAIGAVFADDENEFTAGILGNSSIPAMLTSQDAGAALLTALGNGTVTVTLTHALHNQVVLTHPSTVDNVAEFSSRGISSTGVVKPDVTAPGITVFSAAFGAGNEGVSFSGTSMATPHVAGEAALVLAAHPAWLTDAHTSDDQTNKGNVPLEVKAAIMNTASAPVTCHSLPTATPPCSGVTESPNRVGSGRVLADAAVQTQVIAYDAGSDAAGGVSVSFGRVDVVTSSTVLTKTRTVDVVNMGPSAVPAYSAAYQSSDDMPGVSITVGAVAPVPAQIAPGGKQHFTVTLTVDPTSIQDRLDPTQEASISDGNGGQVARSFIADESGRLVFTAGGAPTLQVPAYAAPRHVSTMATSPSVAFDSAGHGHLPLTGADVEQPGTATAATVFSTVDAMELQGVSGVLPACAGGALPPGCTQSSADQAADLKAVGVTSDVPVYGEAGVDPYAGGAFAYFGVVTQRPWHTPSDLNEYDVMIDANRDGLPDAVLFNTRLPGTDVFVAELDALLQGRGGFVDGPVLDEELLNGIDPGVNGTDTYLFDSNVMTMPFTVAALEAVGFDPGTSTRVNYWVDAISGESGIVDTVGDPLRSQQPLSIDLARPAVYTSDTGSGLESPGGCVDFCFSTLDADTSSPPVDLKVVRTLASVAGDKPLGVLLLHHNNTSASRASLVPFATGVTGKLGRAIAPYGYRNPVGVTVTTTLGVATGAVSVTEGTATLARGTLSKGVAHLTLPVRPVGKHTLVVHYAGDAAHAASSHKLGLTVVKASTATTLSLSGSGTVTLTAVTKVVAPGAGGIGGSVAFYDNGVKFATVTTKGTARASRRLSRGKHVLTAIYSGSTTLASSKGTRTLTV